MSVPIITASRLLKTAGCEAVAESVVHDGVEVAKLVHCRDGPYLMAVRSWKEYRAACQSGTVSTGASPPGSCSDRGGGAVEV